MKFGKDLRELRFNTDPAKKKKTRKKTTKQHWQKMAKIWPPQLNPGNH